MEHEVIADYACVCGESPVWHAGEQCLYWLDNATGRLFRFDPLSGEHAQVLQHAGIAGISVQADGALLLYGSSIGIWRWDGGEPTVFIPPTPGEGRYNDVAVDPEGRVFAGSMPFRDPDDPDKPERLGSLYLIDRDKSCRVVERDLRCSNGIGFSLDNRTMYFIDTPTKLVYAYDYDRSTGDITNRRTFAEVDGPMAGDGMTIDAEGCAWVAMWGGSCVVRYDTAGQPIQTVDLPTPNITSVMFGGPDLDELYITSAGGSDKAKHGPHAGALFRVRPGVKGRPENLSRLGL